MTAPTLAARVAGAREALAADEAEPRCGRASPLGAYSCARYRGHPGACCAVADGVSARHLRALSDALAEAEGERDVAVDAFHRMRRERDALRALLADIRGSLGAIVARDVVVDRVYDPLVHRFVEATGGAYGAIMDATSRLWRQTTTHPGSEFVAGPCRATVDRWIADIDAALGHGGGGKP